MNQDVSASSGQGCSWVIAEVPEQVSTVHLESWALLPAAEVGQSISEDERHSSKKHSALASAMWVSFVMELGERSANPAVTKGQGWFVQANQNTASAAEPELWVLLGWAASTEEQKSLTGAIKVKCSCEQRCLWREEVASQASGNKWDASVDPISQDGTRTAGRTAWCCLSRNCYLWYMYGEPPLGTAEWPP